MRTFIIFLVWMLCALCARAELLINSYRFASTACASTDTTFDHALALEGFTSPLELTWAEQGDTALCTEGADTSALTSGKVAGMCNTGLLVSTIGTAGTEGYLRYDYGSTIDLDTTAVTITFMAYITSPLNGTDVFLFFCAAPTTSVSATALCSMSWNFDGTNMETRPRGSSQPAYTDISLNTWHKFEINLATATTGSASNIIIDGGTPLTFDRGANDLRYIMLGAPQTLDAGDECTVYYDLLCVD